MAVSDPRKVNATEFKARCLGLLDEVRDRGAEVVITKHGKPVARLVPMREATGSLRGAWKGLARIRGDIVHGDWAAEFDATQ